MYYPGLNEACQRLFKTLFYIFKNNRDRPWKSSKTIVFAMIFVENRQKPLVFQCFSSKTAKNREFFNAFRRKPPKTFGFSVLFVENRQKPLFFQCFSSKTAKSRCFFNAFRALIRFWNLGILAKPYQSGFRSVSTLIQNAFLYI